MHCVSMNLLNPLCLHNKENYNYQMSIEKFKGKYRIESNRCPNWNYSSNGEYFITICTANREHYLGKIVDSEIKLSEIGGIAHQEWLKTKDLRKDMNIVLNEFCIMPNHIHAIIKIIDTKHVNCTAKNKFGPQSKNLGAIIRGFKSAVKKYAAINNIEFAWQPNYHDHIIKSEEEFYKIRNYIRNNPKNWKEDRFY